MTGIAIWMFLQIVLMLFFRNPEFLGRHYLGHDRTGPDMRCRHFSNQRMGRFLLPFIQVKNGRTVRCPDIIALPVPGGWIMYLEEKLQQGTIEKFVRIEADLDSLRMRTMIPVCRIGDISAGIAYNRRNNTWHT